MRPLERVLIVVLLFAASLQARPSARRYRRPVAILGVVCLAAHLLWEGGHYQMLPAYAGLAFVVLLQLPALNGATGQRWFAATLIGMLCLLSLGMSYVFPMFTLPKPTGMYAVGTRTVYLTDDSRHEALSPDPHAKRELVVQVWYPANPSRNHFAPYLLPGESKPYNSYESVLWTNSRMNAPIASQGGPFPVLLFNTGWNGRRTLDTFLTEDLASHGFVVVAIDHPYNATRLKMPDGRVIDGLKGSIVLNPWIGTAAQLQTVWNHEVEQWTADAVFVLDSLQKDDRDPRSPWFGHLDTQTVGSFGHSFGGSVALYSCGVDPRIHSAINLDGWALEGISNRTAGKQAMFLNSGDGVEHPERINSPDPGQRVSAEVGVVDSAAVNDSLRRYGGYRLYVRDATHMDFTDLPLSSPYSGFSWRGPVPAARMERIVRGYVLAFFEKTLRGQSSPLLDSGNTSPYPEVRFEAWTASTGAPSPTQSNH